MYDQIDQHLRDCRRHGVEPDWQGLMFDLDPFYDGNHARRDRITLWCVVVGFVVAVAIEAVTGPAGGIAMAVYAASLLLFWVYRFVSARRYQRGRR